MQDPQAYERDKTENGVKQMVDKYFSLVLNKLDWERVQKGNILDYGCGAGSTGYQHILPKVLKTDSTLYSVDISKKMLDFAINNYQSDKIKYSVGNILEKFPLQDVKFDKIVSSNVFHYIDDIRKALKGFHWILKEKGQLGFVFPFKNVDAQVFRTLQKSKDFGKFMKDFEKFYPAWCYPEEGVFQVEELKSLLLEEGFKVSFVEIIPIRLPVTFEMLTSFTLSVNPCADQIPNEMKGKFETEVRKILIDLEGLTAIEINKETRVIFSFDYAVCVADKMLKK